MRSNSKRKRKSVQRNKPTVANLPNDSDRCIDKEPKCEIGRSRPDARSGDRVVDASPTLSDDLTRKNSKENFNYY